MVDVLYLEVLRDHPHVSHGLRARRRVTPGAVVLFCGPGGAFATGTVVAKERSVELGLQLWGRDKNGQIWEYVYFLDGVAALPELFPSSGIAAAAEYEETFVAVQRFTVLDDPKAQRLLNSMKSGEAPGTGLPGEQGRQGRRIPKEQPTAKDYALVDEELESIVELDKRVETVARKEQRLLRAVLFGTAATGKCGICERAFDVSLLVAAHVKRRADCSEVERRDIKNNVMPMCKFGCDDLFERGYLVVRNGVVQDGPRVGVSETVKNYVSWVKGNRCTSWTPSSKPYFDWHASHAKSL